ncbi:MarR family transcriptional regulator [Amycolatopsis sp. K13G38]|uniref:MarR family transcriptional regulator n=1 Tax=Amycolatopsis acididurans TaxID=2724524 RepID=A0ABX1J8Y6_9PSEU|nr:MarR family transcriptional regulator [Amycolatopsis acididurans]
MDVSEQAVRAAADLRSLVSKLRRKFRELKTGGGLTPSQTSALIRLGKEGPFSASELAGIEGMRPQSMAAILAVLGEHGLIERSPDPEDGRRQVITLTGAGRERFEGDRQARREWLARAMQERYSDAERATITEALALLERLVAE